MVIQQTPFERAAAAAKQLQEERERLGLPRYVEDRPLSDLSLDEQRARQRARMLQEGRYGEFLESTAQQLREWQLAEETEKTEKAKLKSRGMRAR